MKKSSLGEKSTFAVAYLAMILATGVFKEGLDSKHIAIGSAHPSLLVLSIFMGCSILLSVYFYALQYFIIDFGPKANKLSRIVRLVADGIYGISVMFPILVVLVALLNKLANVMSSTSLSNDASLPLLSAASMLLGILISFSGSVWFSRLKAKQFIKIQSDYIADLYINNEIDRKNSSNQYTVLHYFKQVELYLRYLLEVKGYEARELAPYKLIEYAYKAELFDRQTYDYLMKIRLLRNDIAHANVSVTKKETDQNINTLEKIINKLKAKYDEDKL
jgi:hypothetical protein